MKGIITALKAKFSRPKILEVTDTPGNTVPVDDASMPDIYADKSASPAPELDILEPAGADKSAGFNPYDTAVLHKKKRSATTRS